MGANNRRKTKRTPQTDSAYRTLKMADNDPTVTGKRFPNSLAATKTVSLSRGGIFHAKKHKGPPTDAHTLKLTDCWSRVINPAPQVRCEMQMLGVCQVFENEDYEMIILTN